MKKNKKANVKMEIGVGRYSNGLCFFTSMHPAFREKWGDRRDNISPGCLYSIMDDLATWANNEVGVGCFFYMF